VYQWVVPATRRNRLNNPLRKLRLILSEDGKTPLDQVQFANRIGLSVATVRAIEAGRRPLSEQCAMQIFVILGASWSNKNQQWNVLGNSKVPYEKKHADLTEALDPEDPYIDDYYVHRLIERVLTLFKGCRSRQQRRGLLLYLSQHLKETAEGFGIIENLRPTEPAWCESRDFKPFGKPLGKEVVFVAVYDYAKDENAIISPHQDAGGIFDFRSWRTFRAEDYPEGKTPDKQDEIVQERTADKQPAPEKNEIFNAPSTHPKTEKAKSAPKKG
jgi:transcriptional regulator with XRE-family HTH domain